MDQARVSTSAGAARIDMRDPVWRDDPHTVLRALREHGIARDVLGIWLVGRHADVSAGLRSTQLSREIRRANGYAELRPLIADSPMERLAEEWMLFNDPPKHTRLRRLANHAFRPPVIDAMRERIAAVSDELIDTLPIDGTPFDLMAALAQPLPVRVVCDILGLPATDFATTKAWSDALALIVEPVRRRGDLEAANRAAIEMAEYLLLVAGHETTTNLIGNGVLTLLRHPDQLARLRADPALIETAVEEILRFEGSVNFLGRHPRGPYTVGDVTVGAGDTIFFMLGAANRDPAVFADPDRFDVGRTPNPQLGFGAGIHYCIGAPLARLEAQIALPRLLARFPHLEWVDAVPRWRRLINLRGLEALNLRAGVADLHRG
jgi:cytochrome P450